MYRQLLTLISVCCLACSTVPTRSARVPISPPPGAIALSRTETGAFSQHEIRKSVTQSVITKVQADKELITIRNPEGTSVSFSTIDTGLHLQRLRPGQPVVVDAYSSVIFSVVDPDDLNIYKPYQTTRLTKEAKFGLPSDAIVTSVENTVVSIAALHPAVNEVTLKSADSSKIRFAVRYPETFQRIHTGDTIALTRLNAVVLKPVFSPHS